VWSEQPAAWAASLSPPCHLSRRQHTTLALQHCANFPQLLKSKQIQLLSLGKSATSQYLGGRGLSPCPCSCLQGRGAQSQPPEGELLLRAPRDTHRHSGHRPKKEDWLQKKDRTQRRPGRGRTKTDGVGELPPRAPPRPPPPTSLTDRPLTDNPTSTSIVADTPTSTSKWPTPRPPSV